MEGLLQYIRTEGKYRRPTRIFSHYMEVVMTVFSEKKDASERVSFSPQ
jgi:hypothetical protein